jgi:hypothetical protein
VWSRWPEARPFAESPRTGDEQRADTHPGCGPSWSTCSSFSGCGVDFEQEALSMENIVVIVVVVLVVLFVLGYFGRGRLGR